MANMTPKELARWQQQQAQNQRDRQDLIMRMGSKGAAPRTPAAGNVRSGSLVPKTRGR
jgi:hypothetical protein